MEREDFASGTSSKSTKLVHGGVRYLEKAVFNFDTQQLKLVFEALHERKRLLQNASHLADALPIMTVSSLSSSQNTAQAARIQWSQSFNYLDDQREMGNGQPTARHSWMATHMDS